VTTYSLRSTQDVDKADWHVSCVFVVALLGWLCLMFCSGVD